MRIIWATRGRSWGFRFLLAGGYPDPLPTYELAFADLQGEPEAYRRAGEQVALRLLDPLNRRDGAGRIIPHDFVVMGPLADDIHSVEEGRAMVWPLVADIYARVWSGRPPSVRAVQSALDSGQRRALDVGEGVALSDPDP